MYICFHIYMCAHCLHTAFFSCLQVTPLLVTLSPKPPPPLHLQLPTLQTQRFLPLMMCTQKTPWVGQYVNHVQCSVRACSIHAYMYTYILYMYMSWWLHYNIYHLIQEESKSSVANDHNKNSNDPKSSPRLTRVERSYSYIAATQSNIDTMMGPNPRRSLYDTT